MKKILLTITLFTSFASYSQDKCPLVVHLYNNSRYTIDSVEVYGIRAGSVYPHQYVTICLPYLYNSIKYDIYITHRKRNGKIRGWGHSIHYPMDYIGEECRVHGYYNLEFTIRKNKKSRHRYVPDYRIDTRVSVIR